MFRDVTRGGQTSLHQFRMMRQVFRAGLIFSIVISVLYTGWNLVTLPKYLWTDSYKYYVATIGNMTLPKHKQHSFMISYKDYQGKAYKRSVYAIASDSRIKANVLALEDVIIKSGYDFIYIFISSLVLIMLFWIVRGYKHRKKTVEKGSKIVNCKVLSRKLKLTNNASEYKVGDLPLEKNTETQHILLTGTTGSGKSNTIKNFIDQIRRNNENAVIVTSIRHKSGVV